MFAYFINTIITFLMRYQKYHLKIWQIFYAAASVSPYFLIRDFGSLLSVSISRFSSAFQLFFLIICKHEFHHFVRVINLVQFLGVLFCLHIHESLPSFKVFYITKNMYCKCDFMFHERFTWWFWYIIEKLMQLFHAIIF